MPMPADWLISVRAALDARVRPIDIFFRDDDAGWDDDRLFELLDCFQACEVPIDLAVIPQATTEKLGKALLARWQTKPAMLGLHQHGFSHDNPEVQGRKCEFGLNRSDDRQYQDLHTGKLQLEQLLGLALDKIFTPPWNRCSQATADNLVKLGFQALSRNRGAAPIDSGALREIPVAIDWSGIRVKSSQPWFAIGQAIADGLHPQDQEPLGIMLHHAVMDCDDLDHLQALLRLLREHANARCRLMREFLHPIQIIGASVCALALDAQALPLTPSALTAVKHFH
jgi:predicted deacetylase